MEPVETDGRIGPWLEELSRRHLSALTFTELRRGLQALSTIYVERRGRLAEGEALRSAGKRAAFACFYGPLHFLLIRKIVLGLAAHGSPPRRIVDLGCGTGAAGAAWALLAGSGANVIGVDRSPWAVQEANWTYGVLGVRGRARQGDLDRVPLPGNDGGIVAAFTLNELSPPARVAARRRLLASARRGARVLVVEPIARRPLPWWEEWRSAFERAGGRADTWRFPVELRGLLADLDRAAGLDHRELTARTLWMPGAEQRSRQTEIS